jgi:hypothetical protein
VMKVSLMRTGIDVGNDTKRQSSDRMRKKQDNGWRGKHDDDKRRG